MMTSACPIEQAHKGIEGRRVLAQTLSLIEGKESDRTGLLLDDGTAHDGTGLVFDQPGHVEDLGGERFFLLLDRGDHAEGSFR